MVLWQKYTEKMETNAAKAYAKSGAAATETLSNIRTVQAFNGVKHEVRVAVTVLSNPSPDGGHCSDRALRVQLG